MYLKILQNVAALVAFQNRQAKRSAMKKIRLKSFPLLTKRKLSFILNFLNNLYNEQNPHAVEFIQNSPGSR